nr:hypothetical protein [Sphingorhabdus sp.]
MKKIFLIGIVSTIALSTTAYAAQPAQAGAAMSATDNTSNFERGEKRKGQWVRGQGAVNRDDSAGRGEQRSRRVERAPQDEQRSERREDRREDRRGNWNQ